MYRPITSIGIAVKNNTAIPNTVFIRAAQAAVINRADKRALKETKEHRRSRQLRSG